MGSCRRCGFTRNARNCAPLAEKREEKVRKLGAVNVVLMTNNHTSVDTYNFAMETKFNITIAGLKRRKHMNVENISNYCVGDVFQNEDELSIYYLLNDEYADDANARAEIFNFFTGCMLALTSEDGDEIVDVEIQINIDTQTATVSEILIGPVAEIDGCLTIVDIFHVESTMPDDMLRGLLEMVSDYTVIEKVLEKINN